MRALLLFVLACILACTPAAAQKGVPVPVIVELFTSEGCSSCPAADKLLAKLHREQPIRGVEIIVLSEHVDYWNRLGWTDPFSSKQFSQRQNRYSTRWPLRLYTPQAVIDGQVERTGNQGDLILEVVRAAAKERKAKISLEVEENRVSIRIARLPRPAAAAVLVAMVEDDLTTEVLQGENRGRRLAHVAVVRRLETIGSIKRDETSIKRDETSWSGHADLAVEPDWNYENLRVVVFVQEKRSRKIVGAAQVSITSGENPATESSPAE